MPKAPNGPPYLCPDGSEPCGKYGYCGHCPHEAAKRERDTMREIRAQRGDGRSKTPGKPLHHRIYAKNTKDALALALAKVYRAKTTEEARHALEAINT